MAACFKAWYEAAKQRQVQLKGAGSMLQWRKLLRIWKVCSSHLAALSSVVCQSQISVLLCGFGIACHLSE